MRNVIEKVVSICVISLQGREVKKNLQLHNIKVSSTTVWRYMTSKGWKVLKRKRWRTCRHGVRRIWKLYSKGRPASKLRWCEPSGDHLDYRWPENIRRTNPKITGRAKAVTTLRLEKCVCRHTLGARTFYTSPLRKCQKTQRRTFWLAIFRLFNVKWIMNNILSFTKGIFNNQWNLSEEKIGTNIWNTL